MLDQPISPQTPAVVQLPLYEGLEHLAFRLNQRPEDYDHDEDGRALSEKIWRWSETVTMHTDDWDETDVVVGYVYSVPENSWLVTESSPAIRLTPNSIYLLRPTVLHGAMVPRTFRQPLVAYISPMQEGLVGGITYGQFRGLAIRSAYRLLAQPEPIDP